MEALWTLCWGKPAGCLHTKEIKVPDLRTLEFLDGPESISFLELPGDGEFPCGSKRILVTENYKKAYDMLCSDDERWEGVREDAYLALSHSTIFTGQPGIGTSIVLFYSPMLRILDITLGKSVGLSYFLVRRLYDKKVTIYCNLLSIAYVFSDFGVIAVSLREGFGLNVLEKDGTSCALVNICPNLESVPTQFGPKKRKGRVVIATSPNPIHTAIFHECPGQTYYTPIWGWKDLYCAR
jgi:hypothetical protein